MNVNRFQERNRPTLIETAAYRYLKYLRNRYIALSSRGSTWPPLKQVTIYSKTQRGIADKPEWRLREYDILLNAMDIKVIAKRTYVGFVRNRRHPRGATIFELVRKHSTGEGKLPVREVLGLPSRQTAKRMAQDVRDQYNRIIRRNRRR